MFGYTNAKKNMVSGSVKVANASGGLTALSGLPKSAADTNNDSIIDVKDYQSIVNKTLC